MPISQDRMLALIQAGRDYQQALQRLIQFTRDAASSIRTAPQSADDISTDLNALASESGLLRQPLTSHSILLLEEQHFRKTKAENIRKKEKMRLVRSGEHRPRRQTSPNTMNQQFNVPGESKAEKLRALQLISCSRAADGITRSTEGFVISETEKEKLDREVEAELRREENAERVRAAGLSALIGNSALPGQEEIEPEDALGISIGGEDNGDESTG